MTRSNTAAFLVTILLLGGLFGCGDAGARGMRPAALRLALETAPGIEVRLAGFEARPDEAGARPVQARVVAAARVLAERTGKEVTVLSLDEPGDDALPRIVLGRLRDPLIRRLVVAAGAKLTGEKLVIEGLSLTSDRDYLSFCFEDPDRPGLPLNLFVARELGALLFAVEDLSPGSRVGLRSFSERRQVVELRSRVGGRWVPGPEIAPSLPLRLPRPRPVASSPSFTVELFGKVDPRRAGEYSAATERALGALGAWLGEAGLGRRRLLLVDSVEDQRQLSGAANLAVTGGGYSKLWVLLAPGVPDDAGAAAARDAARCALGDPARAWLLVGAGFDASDHWWGRSLEAWGQYLAHQELLLPLAEIVDTATIDRHSRHVLAPARALLFRYLRETRGGAALRELWSGEAELVLSAELESAFREWLLPAGTVVPDCGAEARGERLAALAEVAFQSGVALDSNARAGGGYDGSEVARSLANAVRGGANAISLTSFFSEQPPAPRFPGGQLPEGRESLEGDAALAQVFGAARGAGVRVLLLQPHLLLGDSAGYSAWLKRTGIEHWREFFDAFDPMIVHYGLLAELCGVELVSLGTGIAHSSSGSAMLPTVMEFHDQRWTESIELARRAFGGALTYAAASSEELREHRHWTRFDYVGVSLFPDFSPLTAPPHHDGFLQKTWSWNLTALAEVAERAGRPALIVEVGVRSTSHGSTETSIGPGFAEEAEQARSLRLLRAAIREERDPPLALAGLYLWKWHPSPLAGGPTDRGFTPQHKAAGAELSRFAPPQ